MFDPTKYAGAGLDNLDASSIPLLKIIQDSSAEVRKSHPDYALKGIPGAEGGDIIYIPTRTLFKEPIEVVVLGTKTCYSEWRPESEGGGLIAHHPQSIAADPRYRKDGVNEFLGTNELKFTHYFFVLFQDSDEVWKEGLIAMTSSQIKYARAWIKKLLSFRYPDDKKYKGFSPFIFSQSYKIGSKVDTKEGKSWWSWDIREGRILDFKEDADLLNHCGDMLQQASNYLPKPQAVAELPQAVGAAASEDIF